MRLDCSDVKRGPTTSTLEGHRLTGGVSRQYIRFIIRI